jgi:DNA-binding SARP family transcriptional activator
MEFRLLGPFEVAENDSSLAVGQGKRRSLLAVLLLHANEVVSTDRLIDNLWGGSPPVTAVKSVHVYVSHLRRALGPNGAGAGTEDRLLTRGHGYMLRVKPGELDLQVFEDLLAEGRRLRAAGSAAKAAQTLRDAVALWRGQPLADFAYEPFAQSEIARLEELRTGALEERIDSDLAIGRHAEVIGELEGLVAGNPLRERSWCQLMMALYRCGRQGDALEAYRRARWSLVEELGLEPGEDLRRLQEEILRQNPAITDPASRGAPLGETTATTDGAASTPAAAPTGAIRTSVRPRTWAGTVARLSRHRRALFAAGVLTLVGAGVAAAVQLVGHDPPAPASSAFASPRGLIAVDPATGARRLSVQLPGAPGRVAVGAGAVWAAIDATQTLVALHPSNRTILRTAPSSGFPSDIAVTEKAVWVVDGLSGVVTAIDPGYGSTVRRTRFRPVGVGHRSARQRLALDPTSIAVGGGAVWITDGSRAVRQINPASGKLGRAFRWHTRLDGVAFGAGAVWAISGASSTLLEIDPSSGSLTERISIAARPGPEAPYPSAVAVGAGFVWVLNANTADVTQLEPRSRRIVRTIAIGIERSPSQLAAGHGSAWVANADGTLSRLDAQTGAVRTIEIGPFLRDVAVGRDLVWTAASDE